MDAVTVWVWSSQVSHNVYRSEKRGKAPLWTPLISNEGREEEEPQELEETSEEEEEEMDHLKDSISIWRQSAMPLPHKVEEDAEMRTLDSDLDHLHDPHLVKSYTRLENAPFLHFKQPSQGAGQGGGAPGDKWHEWVSLQKDWMNKVEENPDSYFDDCL